MIDNTKRALGISIMLHICFICILGIIAMLSSCCDKPEEVHVFELLGDGNPIGGGDDQPGGNDTHELNVPIPKAPPMKKIEIPEESESQEEQVQEKVKEVQVKESVKDVVPEKKPELVISKKDGKKAKKELKKMNYEDFLKQHKKDLEKNEVSKKKKASGKKDTNKLDTGKVAKDLNDALTKAYLANKGKGPGGSGSNGIGGKSGGKGTGNGTGGSPNGVDPALLSAQELYFSRLYQAIRMRWEKPDKSAGGNLSARVEFTILANGQITNVSISKSSGNKEFDNSVIMACDMGMFEKTIDGKNSTFTLLLKETDQ